MFNAWVIRKKLANVEQIYYKEKSQNKPCLIKLCI